MQRCYPVKCRYEATRRWSCSEAHCLVSWWTDSWKRRLLFLFCFLFRLVLVLDNSTPDKVFLMWAGTLTITAISWNAVCEIFQRLQCVFYGCSACHRDVRGLGSALLLQFLYAEEYAQPGTERTFKHQQGAPQPNSLLSYPKVCRESAATSDGSGPGSYRESD